MEFKITQKNLFSIIESKKNNASNIHEIVHDIYENKWGVKKFETQYICCDSFLFFYFHNYKE